MNFGTKLIIKSKHLDDISNKNYLIKREVKYIMMDGFEEMLSRKNKHLNYKYYWGYGDMGTSKFTIHDYLKTFNDKSLLELEGWNIRSLKKHLSKKGHQIF